MDQQDTPWVARKVTTPVEEIEERFNLQNELTRKPEPPLFEAKAPEKQMKLLTGLDCPAGTQDLFKDFVT